MAGATLKIDSTTRRRISRHGSALGLGWVLSGVSAAGAAPPAHDDQAVEPRTEPTAGLERLSFDEGLRSAGAKAAPLQFGDRLVAVVPDAAAVHCVGKKATYSHTAGVWRVREYPRSSRISYGLAGFDGALTVVGERGALYVMRDDHFVLQGVTGLGSDTHAANWERAWFSPETARLWIRAGKDRLIAVRMPSGDARQFRIPVPDHGSAGVSAMPAVIQGRRYNGRDQIILTMGLGLYLFDDARFRWLGEQPGVVTRLAFVGDEMAAIVTTADGPRRVSLTPRLAAEAKVDLTPREERAVEAARRREAFLAAQDELPGSDIEWFPTLRAVPGVNVALNRVQPGDRRAGFGMEVDAGIVIAPRKSRRDGREMYPGPWVWPAIGYQWVQRPGSGHGVTAGMGVGFGTDFFAMFYTPRAVLGGLAAPRLRPGLRHGVSAQGFWGTLGLEVSHGLEFDGRADHHDLRVSLGINVIMVIFLANRWAQL